VNGSSWTNALVVDSLNGNIGIGRAPTSMRLDVGGSIRSSGSSGAPCAFFDGLGTENRTFTFSREGQRRWDVGISGGETGTGNVGGNFFFNWFNDAGNYAGTALQIARSTGQITLFSETLASQTLPRADNFFTLGNASFRWSALWATNGVIQTSDHRDKIVVDSISGQGACAFVSRVAPVRFRWKIGGTELQSDSAKEGTPRAGRRTHLGFLAQDIRDALTEIGGDCGVWGLSDQTDPESRQWLRPDQLIAVLWAALRETRLEVERLRATIGG
jgi:hypothetical protein